MKKCTYKDCNNEGKHSCIDKNGKEWANLCSEHFDLLNKTLKSVIDDADKNSIKKLLREWVLAHGGSKNMIK